jgi:hypothetical protein
MMNKKYVLIKVTKNEVNITPVKREDYPNMLVFNEACARHPSVARGYASEMHPFLRTLVKDVVGGGKNSHVLLLAEKEYLTQAKGALWGYLEMAGTSLEGGLEEVLRSLRRNTQNKISTYQKAAEILLDERKTSCK